MCPTALAMFKFELSVRPRINLTLDKYVYSNELWAGQEIQEKWQYHDNRSLIMIEIILHVMYYIIRSMSIELLPTVTLDKIV